MPSIRKEQLRHEADVRKSVREATSTEAQIKKVKERITYVGGSATKELKRLGHVDA